MRAGETVLMPVPGITLPHLWILITEPSEDTHLGVFVSVTSLRGNKDQTVALRPGDHPYIVKDSVVYFGDSRLLDTTLIEADIASGAVQRLEPCSASLLRLLQSGVLCSPYTPNSILRLCRETFGNRSRVR
jgi:hypothetical protein